MWNDFPTECQWNKRVFNTVLKQQCEPQVSAKRKGLHYERHDVTLSGIFILKNIIRAKCNRWREWTSHGGGSLGLNPTGSNMRVGGWDGGRVKNDHVEPTGRITVIDGSRIWVRTLRMLPNHSGIGQQCIAVCQNATAFLLRLFSNDLTGNDCGSKTHQAGYTLFKSLVWHRNRMETKRNVGLGRDPSISTTEDYKSGFECDSAHARITLCFQHLTIQLYQSAPLKTIAQILLGMALRPPDNPITYFNLWQR